MPYGHKPAPVIPKTADLKDAGLALEKAVLKGACYEKALESLGKGDFVYIDPPYPPLNSTAYFTHYTPTRFSGDDQVTLARSIERLHRRGALFLMSNASLPAIRELYKQFSIQTLSVARTVSCKGTRHSVGELVITNY